MFTAYPYQRCDAFAHSPADTTRRAVRHLCTTTTWFAFVCRIRWLLWFLQRAAHLAHACLPRCLRNHTFTPYPTHTYHAGLPRAGQATPTTPLPLPHLQRFNILTGCVVCCWLYGVRCAPTPYLCVDCHRCACARATTTLLRALHTHCYRAYATAPHAFSFACLHPTLVRRAHLPRAHCLPYAQPAGWTPPFGYHGR